MEPRGCPAADGSPAASMRARLPTLEPATSRTLPAKCLPTMASRSVPAACMALERLGWSIDRARRATTCPASSAEEVSQRVVVTHATEAAAAPAAAEPSRPPS